ncbi:MAG: response regulator [Deltaproteobacteria bacterium]|nr:response regulator [Deltaproteobacteria bacterium]MBW2533939.1 response regulator [Deltaproteobacteria bacterium]
MDASQQAPASSAARILVVDDSRTILQVVTATLQRNGYEAVAARDGIEGLEKLRSEGPFDLILLDFVMPRMNGYQFCRELRSDEKLGNSPVVLMSARTHAIGDRFVEQTGALDAIGKPFDGRVLVAVVGRVLARAAEGEAARPVPKPDTMIDEADLDQGADSVAPASRHFHALAAVAEAIAKLAQPALQKLKPNELSSVEHVANALAMSMTDDVISVMASAVDEQAETDIHAPILKGDLKGVPLAETLQFLQLQRLTGVLRVSHKDKSMTMWIREGAVDFVMSQGLDEEFRLGRYLVKRDYIAREELEKLVEGAAKGKLLGTFLVEEEHITEQQLKAALSEQCSEITYEALRWPNGRFTITKEPFSEEAEKTQLGLGMSNLVLEGFRRVDEWRQMEKDIDFDATPVVDNMTLGTVDDGAIGESELRVLKSIDGEHTVREIISESEMASFDVIQILYRLLQSRIVRTKSKKK